jgi:Zn-dependent protease with chaperone function
MDSATRNFLALVGICAILAAYAVWGFIAYVLIPLFGNSGGLAAACVLPVVILAALLTIAGGLAIKTLCRQVFTSRHLSRRIRAAALSPTPELRAAAELTELGGRVALVDSGEPFSFVYGVLVPRVAISRGFLEILTPEELRAALEHERYHVRSLDPLRALTGTVLSEAFFLLPSLKVLRARYELARELGADRRAEGACGPRPLVGALLKALEGPEAEPVVRASLAEPGHLDARISRLETGQMPTLAVASSSSLAWSALGASAFLFIFLSAMIGLGGTSALAKAAAYELSGDGISLDALCVAPVLAAALSYRRLVRRACQPLAPIVSRG